METDPEDGQRDIKGCARQIADCLVAPGFAVDQSGTILLLNSLVSAHFHRRRIYINAFQRSAEVVNYFGQRLRRLGFDVHSLEPYSIFPAPSARDVLISVSGSLRTEPVLVSLLHAEMSGLYKFVITAQSTAEARDKFQGVLPVHIPGVTKEGLSAHPDLHSLLPLGSLFELRAFIYLEAIIEVLSGSLEQGQKKLQRTDREEDFLSPDLMSTLADMRVRSATVPQLSQELMRQFVASLELISDDELQRFFDQLVESYDKGAATYLIGYGRNNEIACMFAHRLGNLSMRVAMTPTRLERPTRSGDLVIALSGSGATYEILQRLNGARRSKLRTAVMTSARDSSATKFVDTPVVIPASVEPRNVASFTARNLTPAPPSPPSESTFSLNALLILEAMIAVLMSRYNLSESDLVHTDPWQGYDSGQCS